MYVFMCVYTYVSGCIQRPEDGCVRFPRAGVTGNCKLLGMDVGKQTWGLRKDSVLSPKIF